MTERSQGFPERRRDSVTRAEFTELQREVKINTDLTKDIHAILRGFKLVGTVAKWLTLVAGAIVAIKAAILGFIHRGP